MNKKHIVDIITAVLLIICGSVMLVLPAIHYIDVKTIFIGVLALYFILNLVQFLLTRKDKDYEGLFTSIASIIVIILALKLNIAKVPWYLALTLFIWVILMSLIKLKKADYYNDRKDTTWILKIISLILFILTGLLVTINLYYDASIQVLVLGFFFFIHGMLELFDPLSDYLIQKK